MKLKAEHLRRVSHLTISMVSLGTVEPAPTPDLTALTLSSSTVSESASNGTVIGTIQNRTAGSTLTLTNDAGGRFTLSGTDIVKAGTLDYESATSHSITVTETLDGASNTPLATTLTITVTNVAEATLNSLSLSSTSVDEDASNGTIVGAIQGQTAGSAITITSDAGGRFAISGGNIVTAAALDYETATSHSITLRETLAEASNSPRDTVITISVNNVAEATLNTLTLSNSTVAEDSAQDTVVGTLQGLTAGSTLTLTDNAGGRFALQGSDIVTGATALDFETGTSHSITVREDHADATNAPNSTTLTITVTDVVEAPKVAQINFGGPEAIAGWNDFYPLDTEIALLTPEGDPTGWTAAHVPFDIYIYSLGASTGDNSGFAPDPILLTYWYTEGDDVLFEFRGLDPAKTYRVEMLPSRDGTLNRTAAFKVGGVQIDKLSDSNTNDPAVFTGVSPNASGVIQCAFGRAAGSTHGYLNAGKIFEE